MSATATAIIVIAPNGIGAVVWAWLIAWANDVLTGGPSAVIWDFALLIALAIAAAPVADSPAQVEFSPAQLATSPAHWVAASAPSLDQELCITPIASVSDAWNLSNREAPWA